MILFSIRYPDEEKKCLGEVINKHLASVRGPLLNGILLLEWVHRNGAEIMIIRIPRVLCIGTLEFKIQIWLTVLIFKILNASITYNLSSVSIHFPILPIFFMHFLNFSTLRNFNLFFLTFPIKPDFRFFISMLRE